MCLANILGRAVKKKSSVAYDSTSGHLRRWISGTLFWGTSAAATDGKKIQRVPTTILVGVLSST